MNSEPRDYTNLNNLVREIQDNEVLLPDFQRGFVWKEEIRQVRLLASVLAKMPLGSILLLKADAQEYGCKKIGRKEKINTSELKEKQVKMLLDGQQRITVLTNIFSNIILTGVNYSDLNAPEAMKRRFFLKLPSYDVSQKMENDIWGIHNLIFPVSEPQNDIPDFLTEDVQKCIDIKTFSFSEKEDTMSAFHPNIKSNVKLENECIGENSYSIPLFLLIETQNEDDSGETSMKNILGKIVREVADRTVDDFKRINEYEDRIRFLHDHLKESYSKRITDPSDLEQIKNEIIRQGDNLWKQRIYEYLKACISKMNLHQIVVEASDRERAIDIYENLNLGGVTLSTFELVMAKAAKAQTTKNLADRMIDLIQENKKYPKELLPECIQEFYLNYEQELGYSASDRMNCYTETSSSINKKYTDAFLDILCLLCRVPNYDGTKIETSYIKRVEILKLKAEEINENYEKVCIGIDRALFFLQVRCGLRTIDELQYNLMLVLLGYIFSNDAYFENSILHKRLEAWYWACIFSGEMDSDQNTRIIDHLKICLTGITINPTQPDFTWITKELLGKVMNAEDFSDLDILLMKKTRAPKDVLKHSICQYYLAKTYPNLLTDMQDRKNKINIFMDEVEKLQEHHLIPLAELGLGKKIERNDKRHIINSPLNFVYITREENNKLSATPYDFYKKFIDKCASFKLHLRDQNSVTTLQDAEQLMTERYNAISADIKEHINSLLGN